jgi:hypothetical protein
VTNEDCIAALRPINPKTKKIVAPDWLKRYFGIETRAYDVEIPAILKRSREEGGLFDGDPSSTRIAVRRKQRIGAFLSAFSVEITA